MVSIHSLIPPNQWLYFLPALGLAVCVILSAIQSPSQEEESIRERKKLYGANQVLKVYLDQATSAKNEIDRVAKKTRIKLEEERKRTAFLRRKTQSQSLYIYQLEKELARLKRPRR